MYQQGHITVTPTPAALPPRDPRSVEVGLSASAVRPTATAPRAASAPPIARRLRHKQTVPPDHPLRGRAATTRSSAVRAHTLDQAELDYVEEEPDPEAEPSEFGPPPEPAAALGWVTLGQRREQARAIAKARAAAQRAQRQQLDAGFARMTRGLPSSLLASEPPPRVPEWAQAIPDGHNLLPSGGLIGCGFCGAVTATGRGLLAEDCRGAMPAGSEQRWTQFRQGRLVFPHEQWPDSGRLPTDRAHPVRLRLQDRRWRVIQWGLQS